MSSYGLKSAQDEAAQSVDGITVKRARRSADLREPSKGLDMRKERKDSAITDDFAKTTGYDLPVCLKLCKDNQIELLEGLVKKGTVQGILYDRARQVRDSSNKE